MSNLDPNFEISGAAFAPVQLAVKDGDGCFKLAVSEALNNMAGWNDLRVARVGQKPSAGTRSIQFRAVTHLTDYRSCHDERCTSAHEQMLEVVESCSHLEHNGERRC